MEIHLLLSKTDDETAKYEVAEQISCGKVSMSSLSLMDAWSFQS